ncbi:MAG: PIN domain-containing protein [Gaiellales bacterium]
MKALLDTSVVIDPVGADIPPGTTLAISSITVAELGMGIVRAADDSERVKRTINLQRARAVFEELPVDGSVAEAFVATATAVRAEGRDLRPRSFDLLIAATALAYELPLYTRDIKDFMALRDLIDVRPIS